MIYDRKIDLDNDIRMAMLQDAVAGLEYLHREPSVIHGTTRVLLSISRCD